MLLVPAQLGILPRQPQLGEQVDWRVGCQAGSGQDRDRTGGHSVPDRELLITYMLAIIINLTTRASLAFCLKLFYS